MFHISLENDLRFARSGRFEPQIEKSLTKLSRIFWRNTQLHDCTWWDLRTLKKSFESQEEDIWTRAASAIAFLSGHQQRCMKLWGSFALSPEADTRLKLASRHHLSNPNNYGQIFRTLSADADHRVKFALMESLKENSHLVQLPLIEAAKAQETEISIKRKWASLHRTVSRKTLPQKSEKVFKWEKIGSVLYEDTVELLQEFQNVAPDTTVRAVVLDCNPPYGEVLVTIGTEADAPSKISEWDFAEAEYWDIANSFTHTRRRFFKKWSKNAERVSDLMHDTEFAAGEHPEEDFMIMVATVGRKLEQSDIVRSWKRSTGFMVLAVSHDEGPDAALERQKRLEASYSTSSTTLSSPLT